MGGDLSRYAQQQMARMHTHARFPFLVEIARHIGSDTTEVFRYANSDTDVEYDGKTYLASVFSLDPPDRDGSKIGDAQLSISAVDQFWIAKIRATQIPATITFIAAIDYDDGEIVGVEAIEEMSFTLRAASWNEDTITWAMSFDENMAILVPCDKATAQKVPGVA